MDYLGTIIEESLSDTSLLRKIIVRRTTRETVTGRHRTPWLKQWTLHEIEIPGADADRIAIQISRALDYSRQSAWYADYKNKEFHYIIFKDKIFKISRSDKVGYMQAKQYGISLGIPEYQVDFSPQVEV